MTHQHDSAAVKRAPIERPASFFQEPNISLALLPVLDHHQVAGLFIELREKHPLAIGGDGHPSDPSRRRFFQLVNSPYFLCRKIEEFDRVLRAGMVHEVDT